MLSEKMHWKNENYRNNLGSTITLVLQQRSMSFNTDEEMEGDKIFIMRGWGFHLYTGSGTHSKRIFDLKYSIFRKGSRKKKVLFF